ncbi:MAG: S9 family peptidase [Thermomicrobiales bacterium]
MAKKSVDTPKKPATSAKGKKAAPVPAAATTTVDALRARIDPGWARSTAAQAIPADDAPHRSGRPFAIDDLYAYALPGEPVVSPDGTRAVTAVMTIDKEANAYRSALWLVPVDGAGRPRKLTAGKASDSSPRWSPDGTKIAFISTRDDKKPQLFVLPVDGGEAIQITTLENGAGNPAWAPDSRRIAFTSSVASQANPPSDAGATDADESDVKVITSARYKFDGRGFLEDKVSHIFTVDTESPDADPIQLTSGQFNHQSPAWSPAGHEIAFAANRDEGWDMSAACDIWTIPASGGEPRRLTTGGEFHNPVWSPDGTHLAFTGSADVPPIVVNQQLWTCTATGEGLRSLSAGIDRSIGDSSMSSPGAGISTPPIAWTPDGSAVDALVGDRGSTVVVRFPLDGEVTQLSPSGRHISAFAHAGGNRLVVTAADPTTPFELRLLDLDAGTETPLTTFNAEWLAKIGVAMPEEFWIGVNDAAIQCWLLRPAGNTATSAPVPMVLYVHGGPHGQFSNALFHELQLYAAKGWALLFINPRGSVGYGEDFAQQVARHWGEADTPDFLGAIDHAISLGGIDPNRLGVTGGSYGGFITNWLLGHTDRFRAAATDRSICNMTSMAGTDDIALVSLVPELGTPWENADRYWELSPLKYVANVTTPCLVVHSENDFRCPMEQGEQWFMALKQLGVPTKFVRFPGESHGLSRNGGPKHRVERLEHTLAWFDEYL